MASAFLPSMMLLWERKKIRPEKLTNSNQFRFVSPPVRKTLAHVKNRSKTLRKTASKMTNLTTMAINFLGENTQVTQVGVGKAKSGAITPLHCSLCHHAVMGSKKYLLIRDITTDPKFKDHPAAEKGIKFYCGYVIESDEGIPIGTLSTFCSEPRTPDQFGEKQLEALKEFAVLISNHLSIHRRLLDETRKNRSGEDNSNRSRSGSTDSLDGDGRALSPTPLSPAQSGPVSPVLRSLGSPILSPSLSRLIKTSPLLARTAGAAVLPDSAAEDNCNEDPTIVEKLSWLDDWEFPCVKPPIAKDELSRLEAVERYQLIDSLPEETIDRMVDLVAKAFHVEAAFINILDADKGYMKASTLPAVPQRVPRSLSLCNWTIKKKATFVIPAISRDPLFSSNPLPKQFGLEFYAGTPLICSDGHCLGSLCIADTKARWDFGEDEQKKLEAMASVVMQQLELRLLKIENSRLKTEKEKLSSSRMTVNKDLPPKRDMTILFTDIQGSTNLWEMYPDEMNEAQKLHDECVRYCIGQCQGYEVTTEGDAFQVAFHTSVDAIRCCLMIQERLLSLDWPSPILQHPEAREEEIPADQEKAFRFRGLRVRMGLHTGNPSFSTQHKTTKRVQYFGSFVDVAHRLSQCGSSGQILLTDATWNTANGQLEQLGKPQVIDLGEHVLPGPKVDRPHHIFQLLPSQCSTRLFPPLKTLKQTSPSYWDAPRGDIHLVFLFVPIKTGLSQQNSELYQLCSDILCNLVRTTLPNYNGYECQEDQGVFMLSFHKASDAVNWSLLLQTALLGATWPSELNEIPGSKEEVSSSGTTLFSGLRVGVGIVSGSTVECCPHTTTGRMDYFGPIVNRAARIANSAQGGQILIEQRTKELLEGEEKDIQNEAIFQDLGSFTFKNVKAALHLFQVLPVSLQERSFSALTSCLPTPAPLRRSK